MRSAFTRFVVPTAVLMRCAVYRYVEQLERMTKDPQVKAHLSTLRRVSATSQAQSQSGRRSTTGRSASRLGQGADDSMFQ